MKVHIRDVECPEVFCSTDKPVELRNVKSELVEECLIDHVHPRSVHPEDKVLQILADAVEIKVGERMVRMSESGRLSGRDRGERDLSWRDSRLVAAERQVTITSGETYPECEILRSLRVTRRVADKRRGS